VNGYRRRNVWWGAIEDLGRRRFLIVSRPVALAVLNGGLAAPGDPHASLIPLPRLANSVGGKKDLQLCISAPDPFGHSGRDSGSLPVLS
jgi:hypothetical protein